MLGFLKSATGKLLAGVAVTVIGYEGWSRYKAKVSSYVLQPGHSYSVVLKYTGQGAGGPISTSQMQSYLASSQSSGAAPGVVRSSATSPSTKTVTYLLDATALLTPVTIPTAGLIGATFPAAFGTVSVQSVTNLGAAAGS